MPLPLLDVDEAKPLPLVDVDQPAQDTYHRDRLKAALSDNSFLRNPDEWQTLRDLAEKEQFVTQDQQDQAGEAAYRQANPIQPSERQSSTIYGPDKRGVVDQGFDLARALGLGAESGALNSAAAIQSGLNAAYLLPDSWVQHAQDLAKEAAQESNLGGAQGYAARGAEMVAGSLPYANPILAPLVAGGQARKDVLEATGDGLLANGDQGKANLVGLASALGAAAAPEAGRFVGSTVSPAFSALAHALTGAAAYTIPQPLATGLVSGNDTRLQEQAQSGIAGLPEGIAGMTGLGMILSKAAKLSGRDITPDAALAEAQSNPSVIGDALKQSHGLTPDEIARLETLWKPFSDVPGEQKITPPTEPGGRGAGLSPEDVAQLSKPNPPPKVPETDSGPIQEDFLAGFDPEQIGAMGRWDLDAGETQTELQRQTGRADAPTRADITPVPRGTTTLVDVPIRDRPDILPHGEEIGPGDQTTRIGAPITISPKMAPDTTLRDVPIVKPPLRHAIGDVINTPDHGSGEVVKSLASGKLLVDTGNGIRSYEPAQLMAQAKESPHAMAPSIEKPAPPQGGISSVHTSDASASVPRGLGEPPSARPEPGIATAPEQSAPSASSPLATDVRDQFNAHVAAIPPELLDKPVDRRGTPLREALKSVEVEGDPLGFKGNVDQYVMQAKEFAAKAQKPAKRLPLPAKEFGKTDLISEYRQASGDTTPVQGASGWQKLREDANKVESIKRYGDQRSIPTEMVSPIKEPPKIDTTHDVPLGGGISADGKTVYVDPRMPKTLAMDDGTVVDVRKATTEHELGEYPAMQAGKTYEQAHAQDANPRENSYLKSIGVDPQEYNAKLKPFLDQIAASGKQDNLPPDLHPKHQEATNASQIPRHEEAISRQGPAQESGGKESGHDLQRQTEAGKPSGDAQGLAPGDRPYKRPDLANVGKTEAQRDAIKDIQNQHSPEVVTDEGARTAAKKAADTDLPGQMQRMLDMVRSGRAFADKAESATMQEVMDRVYESHPAEWRELAIGQQLARTKSAQVMQSFVDSMKTPEARAREARGLMATYRRPAIRAHQLHEQLKAAEAKVSELEAAMKRRQAKAPGDQSPSRTRIQGAKKALDDEFQKLLERAKNRFQGKGPAGANLFLEDAYDLLANRVKAGALTFADAVLSITDHIKAFHDDADAHEAMAQAWDRLRSENPKAGLDQTGNVADVLSNDMRTSKAHAYRTSVGPKPLDEMIADAEKRVADLTMKWKAERDRLEKMSPAERLAERDASKPPVAVNEARQKALKEVLDLRKQLADLKGRKGSKQGPELPPDMRKAQREVERIKAQLEQAQALDSKDFERTKEAAKLAGFDVDNLESDAWKDPEQTAAYMSWLEGRHARTMPAVAKAYLVGAIHASTLVVPKKIISDIINAIPLTAQLAISPALSHVTGTSRVKGAPNVGEYRHTMKSILPALTDGWADAGRVIHGEMSHFEAYSEHARINPLIAKTNPGTIGRAAARTLEWGSFLTPVRVVHAFASSVFARLKVAAHAYRTAIGEDGKRLEGAELERHMEHEISDMKSESWRRSVEDAQRATFTESLPKPIKAFTSWKSSPGKTPLEEAAKLAVTSQLPFAQIPFNRVKQVAMNWSPVIGDAMTVARFLTGKTQEGHYLNVRDIPDQIVQAALRWSVGWGAMSLANQQAPDGKPYIIGNSDDKKYRYSAYIGNGRRVNYLELSAAGPGIGLFADYAKGLKSHNVGNDVTAGLAALVGSEHQDPLISPIIDTIKSFQYQPHDREAFDKLKSVVADRIGQTVGSLSPSFVRQLQNAFRANEPDYKSSAKSFIDEAMHAMKAKSMPGLLPDKRVGGKPIAKPTLGDPASTVIWRLVMPFPLKSEEKVKDHAK